WFKRTWVTDHIDYLMNRRILWHNITAAEQNFGLIKFQRPLAMQHWDGFCQDCALDSITAAADYDFFHFRLYLNEPLSNPDEMWISLDTYFGHVGESVLPSGDTVTNRAEFALHLTNYSARLYVTEAYDLYGIFHGVSEPGQQYRSVVSDGAPWNIVRWKVNEFDQDVQYIGNMRVNFGFLPATSLDGVTIYEDHVHVRIPWSLLHFVDPSEYVVFHDDRNTPLPEDTISDGISLSVFYQGEEFTPQGRFLWDSWNTVLDVEEHIKGSYWVMKDRLHEFNNRAIAHCDSFLISFDSDPASLFPADGVLANDFDLDGNLMQALLLEPPLYGNLVLHADGSWEYEPHVSGISYDSFVYTVFDGFSLSAPATVELYIDTGTQIVEENMPVAGSKLKIFPNPATGHFNVQGDEMAENIYLFDVAGKMIMTKKINDFSFRVDVQHLPPGNYYLLIETRDNKFARKVQVL
ncbi:MAG: T9SS type A sorting domain-containing protein, partial [Bacteroidota bacterium]